jgi:hypothetical protein
MEPDRWLHLRHAEGFSPEMFERFRSGCVLWDAYVQANIRERERLGTNDGTPRYVCFPPELSPDRRVASLPVAGHQTLGSRARFENGASYLLREFFPFEFGKGLEEGLTEDLGDGRGPQTSWRTPVEFLSHRTGGVFPFGQSST